MVAGLSRSGHISAYLSNDTWRDHQVRTFFTIYTYFRSGLKFRSARSFVGSDLTKSELAEFVELVKELDTEERIKGLSYVLKNQLPQSKKRTEAAWIKIKETCREIVKRRTANGPIPEDSVEFIDFMILNCSNEKG